MGYYRNGNTPEEDSPKEPEKKVTLKAKYYSSFDELPEETYTELVERSLNIAQRLRQRSDKLHQLLSSEIGVFDGDTLEEAYWRTACTEQLAFMEMQIANLHSYLIQNNQ